MTALFLATFLSLSFVRFNERSAVIKHLAALFCFSWNLPFCCLKHWRCTLVAPKNADYRLPSQRESYHRSHHLWGDLYSFSFSFWACLVMMIGSEAWEKGGRKIFTSFFFTCFSCSSFFFLPSFILFFCFFWHWNYCCCCCCGCWWHRIIG